MIKRWNFIYLLFVYHLFILSICCTVLSVSILDITVGSMRLLVKQIRYMDLARDKMDRLTENTQSQDKVTNDQLQYFMYF